MANKKLKKYPRKPKQSASLSAFQNYKARCKEIDKENAQIERDNKKREQLKKEIRNYKPGRKHR